MKQKNNNTKVKRLRYANSYKDLIVDNENKTFNAIPLSGYMISELDTSSENYHISSDWEGPSGEIWLNR